jgi:hypothetical protein
MIPSSPRMCRRKASIADYQPNGCESEYHNTEHCERASNRQAKCQIAYSRVKENRSSGTCWHEKICGVGCEVVYKNAPLRLIITDEGRSILCIRTVS